MTVQGKTQTMTMTRWAVLPLTLLLLLMQGCGHAPKREHPIPVRVSEIAGISVFRAFNNYLQAFHDACVCLES